MWDIKKGDEVVVETVVHDRLGTWAGKVRFVQYRNNKIENIAECWNCDARSIMKQLGITSDVITKGADVLHREYIPEVDFLYAITRKTADHVAVLHSAVDITGEWFASQNLPAAAFYMDGKIQFTPWVVQKEQGESNFDCISRLAIIVNRGIDNADCINIKVGCPEDKSFYIAWKAQQQ